MGFGISSAGTFGSAIGEYMLNIETLCLIMDQISTFSVLYISTIHGKEYFLLSVGALLLLLFVP